MFGFLNSRLRRHCLEPTCTMIVGDRGTGKSCVMALIAEQANKLGMKVYSQYPYKDCYKIPTIKRKVNGVEKTDIDKSWLYSVNLSNSVVLLDECRTIFPARKWGDWTQADDEFFNFLRKNATHVYLATQVYDAVDLNVKRACDETWYLTKGWFLTRIEASHTTIAKIADKNTEVFGRLFKAGMMKVVWDICEVPVGNFKFYRRPYYDKYYTLYTFDEKPQVVADRWNDDVPEWRGGSAGNPAKISSHLEANRSPEAQNMQDNLQK